MRFLVTGAAGGVATLVLPLLARPDRSLRLLDIADQQAKPGTEIIQASVTDLTAMRAACDGVDAVIHLGGLSTEGPWQQMLDVNIDGTRTVLEAARLAGVRRVLLASSNHAVGFRRKDAGEAPDYIFPRPDTHYGVSKVAMEALGSLYHDRYGLDVVCIRIGSCFARPTTRRMLSTWISPADCAGLFEAALTAPSPGFRVVWGVSANTRRWFSLDEARELGYDPRDDSEVYADLDLPDDGVWDDYLGGAFCSPTLDITETG